RHVVEPAAQHEHEQVAELVDNFAKGQAFQARWWKMVVEGRRESERGKPAEHPRTLQPCERGNKRNLNQRDLPGESRELPWRAAGAEEKRILARIEPIGIGINQIIPAVDHESESEGDVDNTEPEARRVEQRHLREGQQIK